MTPTTKTKDALTGAQKAALVRDYEANTTGSATFTRHTMRADTDEPELVRQEIEYSDFPAELSPMRLWLEQSGDQWILMLPRER